MLQIPVGRDFETKDLRNDLLGGYLGWMIAVALDRRNRKSRRIFILSAMLPILFFVFGTLCRTAFDDALIAKKFPILSDFDTPFAVDRGQGKQALPHRDSIRLQSCVAAEAVLQ
jgi:hypothetical protein